MDNRLAPLCGAGLALVPIPPINGKPTKAPLVNGWNQPKSNTNLGGYSANADDFINCNGFNFGLYHGASNTLALDLDDLNHAKAIFADIANVDLTDWLNDPQRVEVKSPKNNRGKLIFRLPTDFKSSGLKQLKHEGKVIFELRSGNCQDVIIGQHPEGGNYQLIGNPVAIPQAPTILLDMLQHWDDWRRCFDSVLGVKQNTPNISPRQPLQADNLKGSRDPINEFNQSNSVQSVLLGSGYRQVGKDRFIRPNSESKAPGVVIMRNCKDGIERVFSHAGDCLNNGYAHDAFDCFCLLECGGDYAKALNWNPEITKHNQRLFVQNKLELPAQTELLVNKSEFKEKSSLFPLIGASKLTEKPVQITWLVENIIEQDSLNLLFGEPASGKSLFALDWAFCMATGMDWHGHRTKQVDVVIIAGEGFAGLARRLKALECKYNCNSPDRLFISQKSAQLLDANNAKWIAESIKAICSNPGLVIIDTLHRNMDGDENSSQDIGKFISNLDVFMKPLGAAVLVVHHSGHGQKDRSRGSSAIRAAMDGEFSATKSNKSITLACHKAKDFEAFKPLEFSLNTIDIGWLNEDDEPMTSVYLIHQGIAKPNTKKRKLSARDDSILTSLSDAIVKHGIEPTADIKAKYAGFNTLAGKDRKIVHIDHWREQAYKVITVDCETEESKQDAIKKAFKRCRDKLFNESFTVEHGDYAWRIFDDNQPLEVQQTKGDKKGHLYPDSAI